MVIVKDLSRLGRNNIETNEYIDRYFPTHRVRFVALFDDVDTEMDTMGNEMAPFKIVINDYYNRITSKNIKATLRCKKKDGLFLGWKAPYGYKKSSKDKYKLEIDEVAAKVVRRIFKLAREGNGPRQIANILSQEKILTPSKYAGLNRKSCNLWCPRTIDEILANEVYIGNLVQGKRKKIYGLKMEVRTPKEDWIVINKTHEAIIDEMTFTQVKMIRSKNLKKSFKKNDYLFRQFLRCKECGHAICVSRKKNRKQLYTMCSYYQKNSKYKLCSPHIINYGKLENLILDKLRKIFDEYADKKKLKKVIETLEEKNSLEFMVRSKIEWLTSKLEQYDSYFDDIYLDFKKEIIDYKQYDRIKNRLLNEKKDIIFKINKLENKLVDNLDDNASYEKKVNFLYDTVSFSNPSRELLALLIDRIEIDKDKKIDIYLNFKV